MAKNFDPEIGHATRWQKGQPSPNPTGRPKSRLISAALRLRLAEVKPGDGRTYAEIVAENLVEIASSRGSSAVSAVAELVNRIEGKARQVIEVDFARQLQERSDADLEYFLAHNCFPEDECAEGPAREP